MSELDSGIRESIMATVDDVATDFLYDDEERIEQAIANNLITVDEMAEHFAATLRARISR